MTRTPTTARLPRTKKALRIGALLLGTSALCGVGLTVAFADTLSWNGTASSNWFNTGNWTPNTGGPTLGDTAIIDLPYANSPVIASTTANLSEVDVGNVGSGLLTVSGGGVLNNTHDSGSLYVGRGAGVTGTLNVTGANSTVNATKLVIGADGTGTADFEAGAIGNLGQTFMAANSGSVGTLTVNASTVNTGFISIGALGNATATFSNGAVVTSTSAIVADAGGNSSATVSGTNTKWDISAGSLTVGAQGTGTVTVDTAATLLTKGVDLGVAASGSGTLNIRTGAIWTDTGATRVGVDGHGQLEVSGGAQGTTGLTSVGVNTGSAGIILVNGTNSHLTTQSLQLGIAGSGTLSVSGGGLLTSGEGIVGGAGFGTATVTGANSEWDLGANKLSVGSSGTSADTLTISLGGFVHAGQVVIGDFVNSHGTLAILDPSTSFALDASDSILVGRLGTGALHMSGNSTAHTASTLVAGVNQGASGDVSLDGVGTRLVSDGATVIGSAGAGTLEITSSARLTSSGPSSMGAAAGSSGVGTVDGQGSEWRVLNSLAIGDAGTGQITLSNAAILTTTGITLGYQAGSSGTLTVQDLGSGATGTNGIEVGFSGQGTLILKSGGTAVSSAGLVRVADNVGSVGDIQIDGAGSAVQAGTGAFIGGSGAGTVEITNGGVFATQGDTVMGFTNVGIATVTVDGTGSKWDSSGHDLRVANLGTATLTVSGGATLLTDTADIGFGATGNGTVNIQGPGSQWTSTGIAFIGHSGNGTLNITGGGHFTNSAGALLGYLVGSTGVATVDGVGSVLDLGNHGLTVGNGGNGTLNVRNGGNVTATGGVSVATNGGSMGAITVDGAGSSLAVGGGDLNIGVGGIGTMTISGQGAVSDADSYIGYHAPATGTVNMTDVGSSWNITNLLDIGRDATGTVNISTGATANAVNIILGDDATGVGTSHIDGAGSFLNATNVLTVGNSGDGTLILSNGAFAAGLNAVNIAINAGSHGKLIIGADIGQAATGAGSLTGSTPGVMFGAGTGALIFNHTSANYNFSQAIGGAGNIEQLAGVTHLTGDASNYGGNVHVGGGTLYVDNNFGGFGPAITNVTSGGRLGGIGTIHGAVDVANGATLIGVQGHSLAIDGPLTLHDNSIIDATLTNPSAMALFSAQSLTLDGKLNITANGTFGPGIYRLIDYTNLVADNGLEIGTTPDGTTAADFGITNDTTNHIVYLNDFAAAQLRFWDGDAHPNNNAVDGGNGTWTLTSMNFTDGGGTTNGVQTPQPGFVVFMGTPGFVTVDDSAGQVGVTGMQFAVDGYTIAGGAIQLANAQTTLEVGDHSNATPNWVADIQAVLSGTGGLNKTDLGTALLRGVNTYTGLTTISGGTLSLYDSGSIASSSGVADNGAFDFSHVTASSTSIKSLSGTGVVIEGGKTLVLTAAGDTFAGSINGSGGLTVAGGTEVLTGVQGYTGDTNINSGAALAISGAGSIASSLQVFANGTLNIAAASGPVNIGGLSGGGAVQLGANTLNINNNGNFGGVISGSGALHVVNGIQNLTGANTYTGGTVIDSTGALQLGVSTASGSILGDVVDNGALSFARTDTYTFAGNISGTGAIITVGTGTTILTGTNTYAGGTINQFGTLVGSATSFGSGAILDNHAIVLDQATDATFANDISSIGTLEKKGAGVLAYMGNDTATGGTTVSAGTFQIGNGGTTGSITGDVVDNATLAFDRSDAVTFGGLISGTGALSQIGTGTTTLTSAETYTGLTTVSAGTLQLTGAGSINSSSGLAVASGATFDDSSASGGTSVPTLSGNGNVSMGANTLTLTNAAGTFGGVISGTGGLVKQGTGSFNLTGASTYSGPTTVAAGRLAVNGSIANSIVTVQNGATLGGNGTVKGVVAQSGAIVAPGNSIGTLNVAGNYSQAAGSTYQVELTSTGQNDKINATGTATIENGAKLAVTKTDAADYVQGTRYTVLTAAGGVNGAYTLSGDLVTAVYGLAAHYDATHVYLDVFRAKKFVDFATTANQTASGTALDTLPANGALTHALSNLMTDPEVTAALDKVSGEIHASAKTAELEDSRFPREAALGRLSTAFAQGDTDSMHPSLWGQAYGSWGTTDGNGNAASLNRSSRGFLGGVDLPVAGIWRVGFMGGYSRGSFNVKDRSSTGESDNYHLGGYAGLQQGALGVRVGAAYSWHDLTTDRTVAFSGFNNDLVSQYNAGTTQAYGEVGYHVPVAKVDLEPFANLAYVSLHTGGIIETGGAAALTGGHDTQNVTFTTLGLRGKYDITLGDTVIGTHANAGWRHAFGDLTPITALTFAGSSTFSIQGVPLAQDGAAYGAGFDLAVAKDVLLGVSYDGQYAPSANDNTIKLNVDWKL